MVFNLTEKINQIYVGVSVFYKMNNLFQKFPIETLENLCVFLKDPEKTPLLYQINLRKILMPTSNMLYCPWEIGQYYVRNLSLHENVLPTLYARAMPLGDYRMNITFGKKDEVLIMASIHFTHYTFIARH